jgi:hypothetical protein
MDSSVLLVKPSVRSGQLRWAESKGSPMYRSVVARTNRKPPVSSLRCSVLPPLDTVTIHESEEKAGGTQTREHCSPKIVCTSLGATSMLAYYEGARRDPELAVDVALRAVSLGGALCRPCRRPYRCRCRYRRHAGRERPPLPSPLLRPMVQLEGVAHAQYGCLVRPDEQCTSLAVVECAARFRRDQVGVSPTLHSP